MQQDKPSRLLKFLVRKSRCLQDIFSKVCQCHKYTENNRYYGRMFMAAY